MANRPTPVKRPEIRRPTPTQRPAPGMTAPRFDSFFELQDNPLDAVAYPGDVEGNATAEINAALAAIRAEKRARRDAFRTMVDPNFWVCLVFQNTDQKEEFLRKVGWDDLGMKYIDGLRVAERLKVDVKPIHLPLKRPRPAPAMLRSDDMIIGNADLSVRWIANRVNALLVTRIVN